MHVFLWREINSSLFAPQIVSFFSCVWFHVLGCCFYCLMGRYYFGGSTYFWEHGEDKVTLDGPNHVLEVIQMVFLYCQLFLSMFSATRFH